ncbi:MAG: 7-carboxy-7-deazaguanine synthase QueE [Ignavibacteriae bacterium]|nr:7-carboxy-7-deazaguanine synthase QueE [Ignavibacteriota bacterium]MCB9244356.1 7-carboxy-7-deazaguanine synthase QueE [Ignavibacteriales bacterium]
MKISELFYSIQGEGKRTGRPSFFIRTNFCNLRCKFPSGNLCDTPYTSWNPDNQDNKGDVGIGAITEEYKKLKCHDVVITGGEPTMYAEELLELCKKLKEINPDVYITVETNGTNLGKFIEHVHLVSVSPKLSSSVPYNTEYEKMHEQNRYNEKVLKIINEYHKKGLVDVQWKFVYTGSKDIKEIKEMMETIGFKHKDIFLMPEGISNLDLERLRVKTIEACKDNNFNYSDRLHIVAWGHRRGV